MAWRAHRSYRSETVRLWKSANAPQATITFTASIGACYTRCRHKPQMDVYGRGYGRRSVFKGQALSGDIPGVNPGCREGVSPALEVTTFVISCGYREFPCADTRGGGCDDRRRSTGIEGQAEQLHRNRPGRGRGRGDGAWTGGGGSRSDHQGTHGSQAALGRWGGADASGETQGRAG